MLKYLLAVDGSEPALDAVKHAISLLNHGLRAEWVLVNVQEPANLYEMVVAHDPQVIHQISQTAGQHQLQAAKNLLDGAGAVYTSLVVSGDPANTLLDVLQTHHCHGIVVGARGHGNLRNALLGSVSQSLVQESPVPVTVVKHGD